MTNDGNPQAHPIKTRIFELSANAWKNPEQREAECIAIRACEAFALKGIPVGYGGVIPIRMDNIRNRFVCLVRANSFLIRLVVREGRVIAIKSLRIANWA